jgi:hypothetical protein
MSPTAGAITQTKPYEAQVQERVGVAISATEMIVDLRNPWIKDFIAAPGPNTPVYTGVAAAGGVSAGDVCGINAAGEIAKADATAASVLLAVGVALASISAGASGTISTNCKVTTSGKTAGTLIYLSKTAAAIADSAPATATGDIDQVIGTTIGAIEYRVFPSNKAVTVHA